jgi:hypothetical protein
MPATVVRDGLSFRFLISPVFVVFLADGQLCASHSLFDISLESKQAEVEAAMRAEQFQWSCEFVWMITMGAEQGKLWMLWARIFQVQPLCPLLKVVTS